MIALAVPWCSWVPERVASVKRLRGALGITPMAMPSCIPDDGYREFTDRLPNDQWSEQVFDWLASTSADWCLQLQEDALVAPNFWPALRAILESLPAEAGIVGLQVAHPVAAALAREDVRLFSTSDALVGVGWAMRREVLEEFVEWRRTQLVDGWRDPVPPKNLPSLTEDTMIGIFAMVTGRRIYHPIPTIIDHDTSMRSVWGNDDHANRRPHVTWRDAEAHDHAWDASDLEEPAFWRGLFRRMPHRMLDGTVLGTARASTMDPAVIKAGRARIPHVGRFYIATPLLARRWVVGVGPVGYREMVRDDGTAELRRLWHAQRAEADYVAPDRVMIATPMRGDPHREHVATVRRVREDERLLIVDAPELHRVREENHDLVRTRSRFLREFLESGLDLLWMLDSDVSCSPETLRGMVAAKRDVVVTPYPRRDTIAFASLDHEDPYGRPPEALVYRYNLQLPPGTTQIEPDADGCFPIRASGLGCTLIRRAAAERIVAWCEENEPELVFDDLVDGVLHRTAAAFFLKVEGRRLLTEDVSFFRRCEAADIEIAGYFGPGSPAVHHGEWAFRGSVEAFGFRRTLHASTPTDPAPAPEADPAAP